MKIEFSPRESHLGNQHFLRVGCMPSSMCLAQTKPKGIIEGSLFHNVLTGWLLLWIVFLHYMSFAVILWLLVFIFWGQFMNVRMNVSHLCICFVIVFPRLKYFILQEAKQLKISSGTSLMRKVNTQNGFRKSLKLTRFSKPLTARVSYKSSEFPSDSADPSYKEDTLVNAGV